MNKLKENVETVVKLELGKLIAIISEAKNISWDEAESMLPAHIFEGGYILDNYTYDWAIEIVEMMKELKITDLEIYQDY